MPREHVVGIAQDLFSLADGLQMILCICIMVKVRGEPLVLSRLMLAPRTLECRTLLELDMRGSGIQDNSNGC
jgi:hypothetical protein